MKNYKKILILLLFFGIIASMNIGAISAGIYEGKCYGGDGKHPATWMKTFVQKVNTGEIVKKNGEYFKKIEYLYEYEEYSCFHESHKKDWSWGDPDGYTYQTQTVSDPSKSGQEKFDLVKVKKGDVIKKSEPKYWKTIESNGKVQQVYKITKTVAVNSKTLQKLTVTTKKITGYYKTYKMPTLAPAKYRTGYFKGEYFTYGNSYIGYYVDPKNSYSKIYKITPYHENLLGTRMFYKKPSSFTIYVYK